MKWTASAIECPTCGAYPGIVCRVAGGLHTSRIEKAEDMNMSLSNDHGHTAPTATVAPPPDPVNHPAHYKAGTYECREVIAALGLNFNRGSALKYIWRAARKGREIEDLRKARACLDHEIAQLERADGTKR